MAHVFLLASLSSGCVIITAEQQREKVAEVEDTSGVGSLAWVQIDNGENHTCGVHDNGLVECWGANDELQSNAPTEGVFSQVTAGIAHTCAIQGEPNAGIPICWGDPSHGATVAPSVPFTKISAGGYHNCGIQTDGTILCWGENQDSQSNPPPGETFKDISAGRHHTCGVRQNGQILCWGQEDEGCQKTLYPGGSDWVRVESGQQHTCALDSAGVIECWGAAPTEGCQDVGQTLALPPDPKDSDDPWVWADLASGSFHTCGLNTLGEVYCWGEGTDGRTNIDDDPTYVQVTAGDRHTSLLTADGEILCVGYDVLGQCDAPKIVVDSGTDSGSGS